MFIKTRQCDLSDKMLRLNNFLYIFNLRQGTILIAVHQITLSSFLLIILLVGISHVGQMLSMLHNDMEDDAERRGFYEITYRQHMTFHEGDVISTNNQLRFMKAQHLASVTVSFLYTSTILTSMYLMCCISLLHGAVKYKREYVLPWIGAAIIAVIILIAAMMIGDNYPCVVSIFGGHHLYYVGCTLFIVTFVYAIVTVSSFAVETPARCGRVVGVGTGVGVGAAGGERLLLLDHAAHSTLLSTAQLDKLSHRTRTQFV